ncbi:hypothetical protein ACFYTQ_15390 [Nocardia sp. NPDC004068]|uniref:hypothetical protein n=1 Tax=Nocardia sp. NPDC004068 TaxID=3364303 RepID=UPI0036A650AF
MSSSLAFFWRFRSAMLLVLGICRTDGGGADQSKASGRALVEDSQREHTAVGLVCLPQPTDTAAPEEALRALARQHNLELADTVIYSPGEGGWIFRLLAMVHMHRAYAVVALDSNHVSGMTRAVTGAAALITPTETVPFVGYATPGVRAGDD